VKTLRLPQLIHPNSNAITREIWLLVALLLVVLERDNTLMSDELNR